MPPSSSVVSDTPSEHPAKRHLDFSGIAGCSIITRQPHAYQLWQGFNLKSACACKYGPKPMDDWRFLFCIVVWALAMPISSSVASANSYQLWQGFNLKSVCACKYGPKPMDDWRFLFCIVPSIRASEHPKRPYILIRVPYIFFPLNIQSINERHLKTYSRLLPYHVPKNQFEATNAKPPRSPEAKKVE